MNQVILKTRTQRESRPVASQGITDEMEGSRFKSH